MKISIKIFDWNIVFWMFRKEIISRGVSSRIPESLSHCLYLDYDNIRLEVLEDEVKMLIEVCELGDCHIIETSENNYHVESHDYYGFDEVLWIQGLSSCDAHYRTGPTLNMTRGWIHRRSEKGSKPPPKYLKTLKSPYSGKERLQSSWHYRTFVQDFGDVIDPLITPDEGDAGWKESYETLKR